MIDFRYHVVSLVAVFLALSVGMVVGGFALRGPVGDQLNRQVRSLSADKADLRAQLGSARDGEKQRDEFDAAVAPTLLAGNLTGKRVAIVSLPDTGDDLVSTTKKSISAAGGKVASTTTLSDGWLDKTTKVDFRALASRHGIVTTGAAADRVPGLVLAGALTQPASGLLGELRSAGLTDTSDSPGAADAVLVLWKASAIADRAAQTWGDLVAGVGAGTDHVLAGADGLTGQGKQDPLMTALRDTPDAVGRMSSVDDMGLPMGQVAMVYALRDEIRGVSGQYGTASDATAVIPATKP